MKIIELKMEPEIIRVLRTYIESTVKTFPDCIVNAYEETNNCDKIIFKTPDDESQLTPLLMFLAKLHYGKVTISFEDK